MARTTKNACFSLRLGGNSTEQPDLTISHFIPTWHDHSTFPNMPINFAARNLELLNGGTTSDILWPVNNIRGVRTEVVGGEIRESVKRKTELPTIGPRSINSHWHPITWGCVRANG